MENMERREFLKLSGLSTIGLSSTVYPEKKIPIKVNLFKSSETDLFLNESKEEYIINFLENALRSLSTDNTRVVPNISIEKTEFSVKKEYNDIKPVLEKWRNKHTIENSSDSNILLVNNIGDTKHTGWGNYGCLICKNTGIVSRTSQLSQLNTNNSKILYEDDLGARRLITIAHEIGHNLGFKHTDGNMKKLEGNKILLSPMVAGYYEKFKEKSNITDITNPRIFFTYNYNKNIENIRHNWNTKL